MFVGIWLAGLVGIAYALLIFLASGLTSIVFGSWLIKVVKKQSEYKINWQVVVIGVIVLKLVVLIPFVGWLIGFIFILWGIIWGISSILYCSFNIRKF